MHSVSLIKIMLDDVGLYRLASEYVQVIFFRSVQRICCATHVILKSWSDLVILFMIGVVGCSCSAGHGLDHHCNNC